MIKIMKLTNEEKSKVFAMYLGCEVNDTYNNKVGHLVGLNTSIHTVKIKHNTVWDLDYHEAQLHLTPLPKISDEHAIIIAKIVYSDWTELRIEDKALENWLIQEGKKYIQRTSKYDYDVADKLRELGYMLPYKGIDLFESGLAIDKTLLTLPV